MAGVRDLAQFAPGGANSRALRSDGHDFPVEVGIGSTDGGECVVAVVRDKATSSYARSVENWSRSRTPTAWVSYPRSSRFNRWSRMRWITAGSSMQAMTVEHRTCVWLLDLFSQSGCAGSKRSKPGTPMAAVGRQRPPRRSAAQLEITSAVPSIAVIQ